MTSAIRSFVSVVIRALPIARVGPSPVPCYRRSGPAPEGQVIATQTGQRPAGPPTLRGSGRPAPAYDLTAPLAPHRRPDALRPRARARPGDGPVHGHRRHRPRVRRADRRVRAARHGPRRRTARTTCSRRPRPRDDHPRHRA